MFSWRDQLKIKTARILRHDIKLCRLKLAKVVLKSSSPSLYCIYLDILIVLFCRFASSRHKYLLSAVRILASIAACVVIFFSDTIFSPSSTRWRRNDSSINVMQKYFSCMSIVKLFFLTSLSHSPPPLINEYPRIYLAIHSQQNKGERKWQEQILFWSSRQWPRAPSRYIAVLKHTQMIHIYYS